MTSGSAGRSRSSSCANRGAGPSACLNLVDERCGGTFDNIDDVIPAEERTAFMAGYKAAAGFAITQLNEAPPTIRARRPHRLTARNEKGAGASAPTPSFGAARRRYPVPHGAGRGAPSSG